MHWQMTLDIQYDYKLNLLLQHIFVHCPQRHFILRANKMWTHSKAPRSMPMRENMLFARKLNFHFARKIGVICLMFCRTYDAWYQMRAEKWHFRFLRCFEFGSFTWFVMCFLWSDKSYVPSEMPGASDNWGHNTNLPEKGGTIQTHLKQKLMTNISVNENSVGYYTSIDNAVIFYQLDVYYTHS